MSKPTIKLRFCTRYNGWDVTSKVTAKVAEQLIGELSDITAVLYEDEGEGAFQDCELEDENEEIIEKINKLVKKILKKDVTVEIEYDHISS